MFSAMPYRCTVILLASVCCAAAQSPDTLQKAYSFSALGSVECGQIVKGRYTDNTTGTSNPMLHRIWLGRTVADVSFGASAKNRLAAAITLEGELWFDTYARENNRDPITQLRPNGKVTIREARSTYAFFGLDKPYLSVFAGVFPFKYNADARNLGEYLFRTGVYPGYIITSFDDPRALVTGLRLSSTLFERLSQDLILSTERLIQPYHDFSLSYLLGFSPVPAISVGGGVMFDRLFSVCKEYTDPQKPQNEFISESGDTSYYTFRGTKLMARVTIDPKPLLGRARRVFGDRDLCVYGEAAILGVKDYATTDTLNHPDYYGDILTRMPVMVGVNLPAFKVLDVLSLEAEWYGWQYPNTYYRLNRQDGSILPLPTVASPSQAHDYELDDWKWSLYANRTLGNTFGITAQIGRDHLRHRILSELYNDEEECLRVPGEWYWMLKFTARM